MARFLYKAKNNRSEVVTGTVMAANHYEAEQVLLKHNLVPTDIIAEKQEGLLTLIFNKVSAKDRAIITRQLATMLSAGLNLSKAISILAKQAKNERLRKIFLEIYKDLEQGYSFSVALSRHPEAFDKVYVSIVSSGETTGKLDVVLNELANQSERDSSFVAKVKSSLFYPGFIFGVVIAAGIFMMAFVVPKLKTMFESVNMDLPILTKILLATAGFMESYWYLVIFGLIGLGVSAKIWISTEQGGRMFHRFEMMIPGIRNVLEGMYMYRFTRIMSMLVGAGVPLLDALKISSSVIDNPIYGTSIANIASQVERGVPLSSQLLKEPVFPQLIGNMVAVGEETGELDKVLDKVANYYEDQTNDMIKTISSLVEPFVLVLVGLAVAFMVFAIYIPIYQINTSVGG